MRRSRRGAALRNGTGAVVGLLMAALSVPLSAQERGIRHPPHPPPPGEQGSPNVHVLSHLPLGAPESITDVEVEQGEGRRFAFVGRRGETIGTDFIDFRDPGHARVIHRFRIRDPELHQGGAMDGKAFRIGDRHYYLQSFQFSQGGADADLAGIVFDVTGLPDASEVREVRRFRFPEMPGGFHNIFVYKHSDGRVLLFATGGPTARVFDLAKFLEGDPEQGLVAAVPIPDNIRQTGYHDFYVGYDAATGTDRFYGGGGEGYYVYDVTDLDTPELLVTITGVPGVQWGHTFTPTPDGRYAVGETEFQYAPLRIFDLKPALDGEVANIDHEIGMWHADWRTVAHNHEIRWPYVFVSGYETGLSVFDMTDPTDPFTVGYYDTFDGPHDAREGRGPGSEYTWGVYQGAWGVDVRNADGIIVVSDGTTGFWALEMDGFSGWNGNDWGVPNLSSVQHWDAGPAAGAWGGRRPAVGAGSPR